MLHSLCNSYSHNMQQNVDKRHRSYFKEATLLRKPNPHYICFVCKFTQLSITFQEPYYSFQVFKKHRPTKIALIKWEWGSCRYSEISWKMRTPNDIQPGLMSARTGKPTPVLQRLLGLLSVSLISPPLGLFLSTVSSVPHFSHDPKMAMRGFWSSLSTSTEAAVSGN